MKLVKPEAPKELSWKDLKWQCNYKNFKFETTDTIDPASEIVGQEQALNALKLGVELRSQGYNIFITGLSGTGKLTTIKSTLEKIKPRSAKLKDFAYVNNFDDPDQPIVLEFKAGVAKKFKKDIHKTLNYLKKTIPKALESEPFVSKKKQLVDKLNADQFKITESFEKRLREDNFTLGQIQVGEQLRPEIMVNGKDGPMYIHQVEELVINGKISEKEYKKISHKYNEYKHELAEVIKEGFKLTVEFQEELKKLEKSAVQAIIDATFDALIKNYPEKKIKKHLAKMKETIALNLHFFKGNVPADNTADDEDITLDDYLKIYDVNIILDNSQKKDCPVIVETTPTYNNLFGTIEKYSDGNGGWFSDFSRIKGGSLLKANGGYLILNAQDTFTEFAVWKTLKRVLIYGKLEIQDIYQAVNFSPSVLKPEAIEVDIKVIFIGNNYIYSLLSDYENDFNKIFKVKAEFDYEMDRTEEALLQYAGVIKKIITSEKLLPFDKTSVGEIIQYGARYVGEKTKLTTRFSFIADLLRESSYWAKKEKKKIVTAAEVKRAYEEMRRRHSLYENKTQEMITKGIILIDTEGERVGQINGLAVYELNQFSFGKPTRITASVSLGNGSFINVEREAGLSGSAHNKAVLIISGYFRELFGKRHTLSFNASIVFEQAYGKIDGDSASVTEIAAIISAISELPIKQNFAITGSINQKGDIQPIGGVNEKVEGFFDVCKAKGLTGNQGVIIPIQNINDLMLKDEVVTAVKKKKFHLYYVSRVEEALEILFGAAAGKRTSSGKFQANTIYGLVEKRLEEMYKASRPQPAKKKKSATKKTEKKSK